MRSLFRGVVLALSLSLLSGCDAPRQQVAVFERNQVPERLSEWHLLQVRRGQLSLNDGVTPYDLNTALFSDYAHKLRTLWMPAGTSARYGEENFDYPVGTIISKTFYYPKDGQGRLLRTEEPVEEFNGHQLNLKNVQLVETRLLVKREDGWQALPYVWNAEQTEATLELAGDMAALQLVDASGSAVDFHYIVPDSNQCASCHADEHNARALRPLGPRARNLNRDYAYAGDGAYTGGVQNQLLHWQQIGYLSGLPEFSQIPRSAAFKDADQPLEERARAYLDINCGHCHNPVGPAKTSGLMLHHAETDMRRLGRCKPPIAAGTGSGDRLFGLVPGSPQESILNYRVESTDPGAMMPELGRSLAHEEGAALLREWIAGMPGSCG